MNAIENVIGLIEFGSENFAYNLDKIPADKITWKPAPVAKSAHEITVHLVGAFNGIRAALQGIEHAPQAPEPANIEEAKHELRIAVEKYLEMLRGYTEADLEGDVQMGFGPFPRARAFSMPLVDLLHHHGQLAYIQTLLGDEESHFKLFGT